MRRAWRLRRQPIPVRDGAQRWDRAYQAILQWTFLPVSQAITVPVQENEHAFRDLCAGLDDQPSPDPNHRPAD